MHRPMWEKGGIIYALHRSIQRTHYVYFQRLLKDRHTLCGYQRMAWQEQTAAKGNILWIPHRRKVLPFRHNGRIFWSTLWRTPRYDMRSDSYPHQWGTCRSPVLSAREKEGNHLPLLFRALHAAGNRGVIWTLPEYGMASHTQCLANVTWRNGGDFPWGILNLCHMKPLSERPAESQKQWTRFYGIMASESGLLPLKTDRSTRTPRTI